MFTSVSGTANAVDYSGLFNNIASGDTINSTLASTVKSVKLTAAAETVKLNTSSEKVVFTSFTQGTDKIDYAAVNANLTGASASTVVKDAKTTNAVLLTDKEVFYVDLSSVEFADTAAKASDLTNISNAFKDASTTFASGADGRKATLVVKHSDKTALYELTADSTEGLSNDTIKIIATIDSAVADLAAAQGLFGTLA